MPILNWNGKSKVINYHFNVPYHILDLQYTFGANNKSKSMIIHADNLIALKSLLPQYEGKVDCIYIDPPYNTGNEKWVYNDNVNDPKFRKWLGQVVGKEGEDLSRHDKWLCMMYPRLKLLARLLSSNGVIFISIDDNEFSNLKAICDEIFGHDNALGPIIQDKGNAKNDTHNVQKNHEYIIAYRKKIDAGQDGHVLFSDRKVRRHILKDIQDRYFYLSDPITTRGEGGTLRARKNLGYSFYLNPDTQEFIPVMDYDQELALTANDEAVVYKNDSNLKDQGYTVIIRPPRVRGQLGAWTWDINKAKQHIEDLYLKPNRKGSYSVCFKHYVPSNEVFEEDGCSLNQLIKALYLVLLDIIHPKEQKNLSVF